MNDLERLKKNMQKDSTNNRAINLCIDCKEPAIPKCYTPAGEREYYISGICEECFNKMFK